MTLHTYLTFMFIATLTCWFSWGYSVLTINPEETNWVGFILFYVSLYLAVVGTMAIGGFLLRFVALKQKLAFRSVREAFRQSFLFSLLIIISLLLLSRNLFTWLNLCFLIVGISILELFLLNYKKPVAKKSSV